MYNLLNLKLIVQYKLKIKSNTKAKEQTKKSIYTFPCIDEQTVDANRIPTPIPTTLQRVEKASPLANRSLRFPSLANEEYIGNRVALAATTAIPC